MPKVVCPNGHKLTIQDAHMGQTIRCPGCQVNFVATAADDGGSFGGFNAEPGGTPVRRSFSAGRLMNSFLGKPLLFLGLVLVVFGRGCDAISLRSVSRSQAFYQQAATDAKDKDGKADNSKRLETLQKDARSAMNYHRMWMYWFEWVFIFGTVTLMTGLLILAFTGEGPERWIAYIMIAIITFSIYVGGAAWIESVASSFMSSPGGMPGPMGR